MIPILLCLLICLPIACSAQDSARIPQRLWTLETGYQHTRILDKNASPLLYAAHSGVLGGKLITEKTNCKWQVAAAVSLGNNQSTRLGKREAVVFEHYSISGIPDSSVYVINPFISYFQLNLSYSYYRKLSETRHATYVGAQLLDNFFYSGIGADTWFFNQLSLMPSFEISIFNKPSGSLVAEVAIPVVSYLLRQPYTLDPSLPENSYLKAYLKTGSNITSLNDFQQLHVGLTYRIMLENQHSLNFSYKFMWMNYSNIKDRNLQAYSNSLLIAYSF